MWAGLRLLRATLLVAVIFWSYLLQLGLERVVGRARLRERWRRVHRRNARRLYRGIVRLRGVFIKMGQVLSIMGTFLPRAYAEELETLQDQVPPHPFDEMKRTFVRSIGREPAEVFSSFNETPLAAASLGQVHRATRESGDEVAVKILYPNVATIIRIDLRVLRWAMRLYALFVPVRALERVIDQLQDLLARETDYVNEARCLERMAAGFVGDPDILFPKVHWDLTTREVLTMSFMPGIKISRREALLSAGISPDAVAARLVEAFYKQLFIDGFFHADPHPGNFLVQAGPDGRPRIVMLDFGAATETRPNLVTGMLEILQGLFARDDAKVIHGIEVMGFASATGDRELLHRTIRAYFQKLLDLNIQDFGRIKPDVALKLADPGVKRDELRDLMKSVQYPEGWFYVERAVVIIFGLCAQLAPRMNTIQVGFPYLMRLMADRTPRAAE
jgi:ubiquinone biosynthesis protein